MKIHAICKMHFPLAILNADWMNACHLLDVRINKTRELELLFLFLQIYDRFNCISIGHKKTKAIDLYQTLNTHTFSFECDSLSRISLNNSKAQAFRSSHTIHIRTHKHTHIQSLINNHVLLVSAHHPSSNQFMCILSRCIDNCQCLIVTGFQ